MQEKRGESRRETIRETGRASWGKREGKGWVNMIKVCYKHV
jgi:hypothetical protein